MIGFVLVRERLSFLVKINCNSRDFGYEMPQMRFFFLFPHFSFKMLTTFKNWIILPQLWLIPQLGHQMHYNF